MPFDHKEKARDAGVERLLAKDLWQNVSKNNADPTTPQRSSW
jgi:hypothetical protein